MIRAARATVADPTQSLDPVLEVVRHMTGLTLPERTAPDNIVRREMRNAGAGGVKEYVGLLSRDQAAFDALVTALTVGETYFLREREQLDFIAGTVLPELARQAGGRTLTAWSAGCARGEEPYSLAIVALEAGLPMRVLGTDISLSRLEHARQAEYGEWSFRGVSSDTRARHFRQAGRRFELLPAIRAQAELRLLNLAADDWSATDGFRPFDLILCRNTLIYLDPPTISRVARRLMAALAPSGWLFLGASDPLLSSMVDCEVVLTGAGVAYRHVQPASATTAPPRTVDPLLASGGPRCDVQVQTRKSGRPRRAQVAADTLHSRSSSVEQSPGADDGALKAFAAGDYSAAADLARRRVTAAPADVGAWVLLVRSLANLGRLQDAGTACAAAQDLHRNSAELSYLHGLLLREGGFAAESIAAFRAAIYLDRTLVIAHLALGDAHAGNGDVPGAVKAFRNARKILEALPDDAVVPATDGLLASAMRQLTRGRIAYWRERSESAELAGV